MAPQAPDAKGRRVVQSSPVKGATSPFKAKQLGKQQDAEASGGPFPKPPVKLPAFPAKKGTGSDLKSPMRPGFRDEALPTVPVGSTKDARHHPAVKTGAERLGSLAWHGAKPKADDYHQGTVGFESPQKSSSRHEIAKDEVRAYVRRHQRPAAAAQQHYAYYDSDEDGSGAGNFRRRGGAGIPEGTDDDVAFGAPDQSPVRCMADASPIPLMRQRTRELPDVALPLTDDEFQVFTRDVAARIIQSHWRQWQAWKLQVRQEAEDRILRQLMEGGDEGLKLLIGNALRSSASGGAGTAAAAARRPATAAAKRQAEDAVAATAGLEEPSAETPTAGPRVLPSKHHPGGHAVYTFVPTPRSMPSTPVRGTAVPEPFPGAHAPPLPTGAAEAAATEARQEGLTQGVQQLLARMSRSKPMSSQDLTDVLRTLRESRAPPPLTQAADADDSKRSLRCSSSSGSDVEDEPGSAAPGVGFGGGDDGGGDDEQYGTGHVVLGRRDDRRHEASLSDDLLGQGGVSGLDQDTRPAQDFAVQGAQAQAMVQAHRREQHQQQQVGSPEVRQGGSAANTKRRGGEVEQGGWQQQQHKSGQGAPSQYMDGTAAQARAAPKQPPAADSRYERATNSEQLPTAAQPTPPDDAPRTATQPAYPRTSANGPMPQAPPSPRSRSRTEALQRLKQQGSQRSILAGASGPADEGPALARARTSHGADATGPSAAWDSAAATPGPRASSAPSSRTADEGRSSAKHAAAEADGAPGPAVLSQQSKQDMQHRDARQATSVPSTRQAAASPAKEPHMRQVAAAAGSAKQQDAAPNSQVLSLNSNGGVRDVLRPRSAADPRVAAPTNGLRSSQPVAAHAAAAGQHRPRSAHASLLPAPGGEEELSSSGSEWEGESNCYSHAGRGHHNRSGDAAGVGRGTSQATQGGAARVLDLQAGSQMRGAQLVQDPKQQRSSGAVDQAWGGHAREQHVERQPTTNANTSGTSVAEEQLRQSGRGSHNFASHAPQAEAAYDGADGRYNPGQSYGGSAHAFRQRDETTPVQAPAELWQPAQQRQQQHPQPTAGAQRPQTPPPQAHLPPAPAAPVPAPPPTVAGTELAASLTAEKMTSILKYLDQVEQQAEQEVTKVALGAMLRQEASSAASPRSHHVPARRATAHSRPGTAHAAGGNGSLQPPRSSNTQLLLADGGGSGGKQSGRPRSRSSRGASPAFQDGLGDDEMSIDGGASMASGAHRSAFLAESVYDSVRAKIRRLQDDVKERDLRIQDLQQDVDALQQGQRTMLLESDGRLQEMLATQRTEYEAAVARHLAFVDRLLADKDVLTRRVAELSDQLQGSGEKQERAIGKLKEGWVAELKRQKEGWAAAEKQRREAWMEAKASEIKDLTVKGLEGEVQKLLARHKAELSAVQQAASDEARKQLDAYITQNELAVRQLKERLSYEAEQAVEKERGAGAARLREVSERYEQQLQTQRMRLVADADLKLEQLEQSRKEEKRRYDEALGQAREAGEGRTKELEEGWKREKEGLRKAHDKQIEALREQYETGQEGWRAAMAERARKEVTERTAAIRDKLMQERNNEIEAIMARLEAEHALAREQLKEDFRRREEATAAQHAAALKEARKAEAKMAERFRAAGLAGQAAEERVGSSELQLKELRRELESKSSTIRWLESQVSAAKDEAHARERDLRSLGAQKEVVQAEAAQAVQREKQQLEQRLAQAAQEYHDLRSRHATEMSHVEARIKATLVKKDETIQQLRDQLAAMAAELRSTQEVLRQQQDELEDDDDSYN